MMEKPSGFKRNQLEQFRGDILALRAEGYSYRQIKEWLENKEVNVTSVTVNRFILKNQ